MRFKKTLLFPFHINSPYFEGYGWALELALRMKARLQLFTTTSVPGETISPDLIYDSLLEAQGYYLEHYQHPGLKSGDIVTEPTIINGDLTEELVNHLKTNDIDIVVINHHFLSTHFKGLREIEKESKAMIILPERQNPSENKAPQPMIDHFYDILRRSELYKLPENFFATLGNDISVFNYLRKFFQKKAS